MNFALLIASLLAGIVQATPQISASIKQIVQDVYGSLSAVVASCVTNGLNPSTVLAALSGVITALKADPTLPASTLNLISALETAAAAALAADQAAQQQVNPATLAPIAPIA